MSKSPKVSINTASDKVFKEPSEDVSHETPFDKLAFYYHCFNSLRTKLGVLDLGPTPDATSDYLQTIIPDTDPDKKTIITIIMSTEAVSDSYFERSLQECLEAQDGGDAESPEIEGKFIQFS